MVVQSIWLDPPWWHQPWEERLVQIRDLLRRNRFGHLNGGTIGNSRDQHGVINRDAAGSVKNNHMTLGFAQKCRKHHVMAILMGKWGLKSLYVGLFPCFSQHVHPCSIQPRPMFNMAAMCHGRPSWWDWGMVIPPWSFVFWTHISAVQSLQAGATDLLRHRWCKSALPNLLVVQHPDYKNLLPPLQLKWFRPYCITVYTCCVPRRICMIWYHLFQRFSAHDILLQWFWRCPGDQSWR